MSTLPASASSSSGSSAAPAVNAAALDIGADLHRRAECSVVEGELVSTQQQHLALLHRVHENECTFVPCGENGAFIDPVGLHANDALAKSYGGPSVHSSCPPIDSSDVAQYMTLTELESALETAGTKRAFVERDGRVYCTWYGVNRFNLPMLLEYRVFRCFRLAHAHLPAQYRVKWDSAAPEKKGAVRFQRTHGVIYPNERVHVSMQMANNKAVAALPHFDTAKWSPCQLLLMLRRDQLQVLLAAAGSAPPDPRIDDDLARTAVLALERFGQTDADLDAACIAWEMACWMRHCFRLHAAADASTSQPTLAELCFEVQAQAHGSAGPPTAWDLVVLTRALRAFAQDGHLDDAELVPYVLDMLTSAQPDADARWLASQLAPACNTQTQTQAVVRAALQSPRKRIRLVKVRVPQFGGNDKLYQEFVRCGAVGRAVRQVGSQLGLPDRCLQAAAPAAASLHIVLFSDVDLDPAAWTKHYGRPQPLEGDDALGLELELEEMYDGRELQLELDPVVRSNKVAQSVAALQPCGEPASSLQLRLCPAPIASRARVGGMLAADDSPRLSQASPLQNLMLSAAAGSNASALGPSSRSSDELSLPAPLLPCTGTAVPLTHLPSSLADMFEAHTQQCFGYVSDPDLRRCRNRLFASDPFPVPVWCCAHSGKQQADFMLVCNTLVGELKTMLAESSADVLHMRSSIAFPTLLQPDWWKTKIHELFKLFKVPGMRITSPPPAKQSPRL